MFFSHSVYSYVPFCYQQSQGGIQGGAIATPKT